MPVKIAEAKAVNLADTPMLKAKALCLLVCMKEICALFIKPCSLHGKWCFASRPGKPGPPKYLEHGHGFDGEPGLETFTLLFTRELNPFV